MMQNSSSCSRVPKIAVGALAVQELKKWCNDSFVHACLLVMVAAVAAAAAAVEWCGVVVCGCGVWVWVWVWVSGRR